MMVALLGADVAVPRNTAVIVCVPTDIEPFGLVAAQLRPQLLADPILRSAGGGAALRLATSWRRSTSVV